MRYICYVSYQPLEALWPSPIVHPSLLAMLAAQRCVEYFVKDRLLCERIASIRIVIMHYYESSFL